MGCLLATVMASALVEAATGTASIKVLQINDHHSPSMATNQDDHICGVD
jgi:hypothetical protein